MSPQPWTQEQLDLVSGWAEHAEFESKKHIWGSRYFAALNYLFYIPGSIIGIIVANIQESCSDKSNSVIILTMVMLIINLFDKTFNFGAVSAEHEKNASDLDEFIDEIAEELSKDKESRIDSNRFVHDKTVSRKNMKLRVLPWIIEWYFKKKEIILDIESNSSSSSSPHIIHSTVSLKPSLQRVQSTDFEEQFRRNAAATKIQRWYRKLHRNLPQKIQMYRQKRSKSIVMSPNSPRTQQTTCDIEVSDPQTKFQKVLAQKIKANNAMSPGRKYQVSRLNENLNQSTSEIEASLRYYGANELDLEPVKRLRFNDSMPPLERDTYIQSNNTSEIYRSSSLKNNAAFRTSNSTIDTNESN